jgi:hypothetical protein
MNETESNDTLITLPNHYSSVEFTTNNNLYTRVLVWESLEFSLAEISPVIAYVYFDHETCVSQHEVVSEANVCMWHFLGQSGLYARARRFPPVQVHVASIHTMVMSVAITVVQNYRNLP